MAGIGQRFMDAGHKNIKPLIEVDGKPIIEHVTNLFPGEEDFLFICNNRHLTKTNLKEVLLKLKPQAAVVGIDSHKKGPVNSVMEVLGHIKDNEPIIFSYCDYNMFWDYGQFKKFAQDSSADGIVASYTGFHPHLIGPNFYAGVKTDEQRKIFEIKEKYCFHPDKLKGWHSAGLYYFSSGLVAKKYFTQHAQGAPHDNGEYYISTVYNDIIKDRLACLNYPIEYFCQWGTPEDLEEYELWMNKLKNDYKPKNDEEKQTLDYWTKFLGTKD